MTEAAAAGRRGTNWTADTAVGRRHSEMIDELLSRRDSVQFRTIGTSMRWLIPPSSVIHVKGCRVADIRLGEVVLVRTDTEGDRKYTAHRVVKIRRRGSGVEIVTKGDSSPQDSKPIVRGDCVGKVFRVDSPEGTFRLDRPIWGPVGAAVARLSAFSGWIKAHAPAFLLRSRAPGRTVFPQILVHSALKRVLWIGKTFSRTCGPGAD